jgi:hypothetical protein
MTNGRLVDVDGVARSPDQRDFLSAVCVSIEGDDQGDDGGADVAEPTVKEFADATIIQPAAAAAATEARMVVDVVAMRGICKPAVAVRTSVRSFRW